MDLTQKSLANALRVKQASISKMERSSGSDLLDGGTGVCVKSMGSNCSEASIAVRLLPHTNDFETALQLPYLSRVFTAEGR